MIKFTEMEVQAEGNAKSANGTQVGPMSRWVCPRPQTKIHLFRFGCMRMASSRPKSSYIYTALNHVTEI